MNIRPLARSVALPLALSLALPLAPSAARAQAFTAASVVPIDRIVAIVGKRAITRTELQKALIEENGRRFHDGKPLLPSDTSVALHIVLESMVDDEVLIQRADAFKLTVTDDELAPAVDQRLKQAEADFRTPAEFQLALQQAGLNSKADLRKQFLDQDRRNRLEVKLLDTLGALGRRPKVNVTEKEIREAYDSLLVSDTVHGPTITFRQIVFLPAPSDSADKAARKLADSLLALIKGGAGMDSLARKYSADSVSAAQGGLLPFYRRDSLVVEFSKVAFSLPVGVLGPVVKTRFGYHVLRVERVRAGEVQVRHILIAPKVDVGDLARTHVLADSVSRLLLKGANYDSLAVKYNDNDANEMRVVSDPYRVDSLPSFYKNAVDKLKPNEISASFEIPSLPVNKVAIVQILTRNESGIRTYAERHEQLRAYVQQAASMRHLLDTLRRETYVSIRLDTPMKIVQ